MRNYDDFNRQDIVPLQSLSRVGSWFASKTSPPRPFGRQSSSPHRDHSEEKRQNGTVDKRGLKIYCITHIVKEVGYVFPMTRGQGGVELDVPILADEVVRADLRQDEVEDALGEPAHQLDGELVGDEEVAVGQHVREAGVQGLVL